MNETNSKLKTVGLKTKAVRGAGISIVAHFLGSLCHLVGVIVLARLLKPKDFGVVAMVTAFSLWVMNFGINGFTEYIIQKQDIRKEEVNSIFWLHFFLAIFMAFVFTFFGLILVDFYAEPALSGIAAAMATSIILTALYTSPLALLKREMQFTSIAIIELIAVILSMVFAIVVALKDMAYWAVVTRQLTIPVVTMVAVWIISPWRPSFPRYLSSAVPGLKYAIQVYCNFSLGYLMRNIDKVLLGKFHGSELLGNYDRAYHLSSLPADQLLTPLHSVALATLSRLKSEIDRYFAYYIKALSMIAFLGTIVAVLLTLSAQDLILLLLGPEWTEAGLVVMAFGPGIAAILVYGTHSWLHLSLGFPNRWLRWNIFAALLTVIIFIIAAPFGAVAMGIAYSTRAFLLVMPGLWYAGRPIRLGVGKLISCIWAYFASAIFICSAWLYFSSYWLPLRDILASLSPLNRVIMTSCISSFLYIAIVTILQRGLYSVKECLLLARLIVCRRES